MQAELIFPSTEVMTFREFTARRGYDVEISHDMLRFPHGISKRQARDNKRAAIHHLGEAFRAAKDYQAAVDDGSVRPPTGMEQHLDALAGHPDHDSVKATWRVAVKRLRRNDPAMDDAAAVAHLLREKLAGSDPWAGELGSDVGSFEQQVAARLAWLVASKEAA